MQGVREESIVVDRDQPGANISTMLESLSRLDTEIAVEKYLTGQSMLEIADQGGWLYGHVRRSLIARKKLAHRTPHGLDVVDRVSVLLRAGRPSHEVARLMGISAPSVSMLARRVRHRVPPRHRGQLAGRLDEVVALRKQGVTFRDMAVELGVTFKVVCGAIDYLRRNGHTEL